LTLLTEGLHLKKRDVYACPLPATTEAYFRVAVPDVAFSFLMAFSVILQFTFIDLNTSLGNQ